MKRREFTGSLIGGSVVASVTASALPQALTAQPALTPRKNPHMHVGGDYHAVAPARDADITGRPNLEYNLRHGVKHLTAQIPSQKISSEGAWDLDELRRMRDNCDRLGVTFEAIRMDSEYIKLRDGPKRDRRLENIVGNIEKASKIGVTVITHHWTVIPIRRNTTRPGRGGSTYPAFKLEDNWKGLPMESAGRVDHDDYWERITYFLERVIPACKQFNVKMACHPYDPPGLPFGYQGADNWDSPSIFDAFKRYEAVIDSPYNGFQLCLGTVAEGLDNPRTEVPPIVRYLGERGKIHQIHMRNIHGGLHDFAEVYPDEGEMDFAQITRILRDTQFVGSICPDHMPSHDGDPGKLQAFAYATGYISALIQALNNEVDS